MISASPMSLAQWQLDLSAFALHGAADAAARLLPHLKNSPVSAEAALAVHAACVHAALRSALAQRVPTVVVLVGEDFFTILSEAYARAHPPTAPQLSGWGDGLPAFIVAMPACAAYPWLADMADFDLALDRVAWANPEDSGPPLPLTPDVALVAAPGLAVLRCRYAVDRLRDAVAEATSGNEGALSAELLETAPRCYVFWCAADAAVRCREISDSLAEVLETLFLSDATPETVPEIPAERLAELAEALVALPAVRLVHTAN
jgi:hypothetical protein